MLGGISSHDQSDSAENASLKSSEFSKKEGFLRANVNARHVSSRISKCFLTGIFMDLLIVEDNLKMRRMIKSIVARIADRIDECADGDEAIALYSKNRPDWVLMDIHLKETNGIEATREITSMYEDAKIIIVTNYNDEHFRESAREAGAVDYILKENLLDIVPIIQQQKKD